MRVTTAFENDGHLGFRVTSPARVAVHAGEIPWKLHWHEREKIVTRNWENIRFVDVSIRKLHNDFIDFIKSL